MSPASPTNGDVELALRALTESRRKARLGFYRPYPKQFEFHAAGKSYRERLLLKGNRAGGTQCAAFEFAMHLTARYPEWWPGKIFRRPITAVTGSKTGETSRNIIQNMLFGTTVARRGAPDFGTGTIPGRDVTGISTRQSNVSNVMDQAIIASQAGGESTLLLKSFDQGQDKWMGFEADIIWLDEEADAEIYSESQARIGAVPDASMMSTFTNFKGMTDVVKRFVQPQDGDIPRSITHMSIYDAVGGTWPKGTPWEGEEWAGHFTREHADLLSASYEEYERESRVHGAIMQGEGRVFRFPESQIVCDPIAIPKHYRRIVGLDFGLDHPFGAVEIAHSGTDGDVVYITKCFRKRTAAGEAPLAIHGAAVIGWGGWQPIAWPHDGENRQASGKPLHTLYRRPVHLGGAGLVNMLPLSARYDNDKGGAQPVEPIVTECIERMATGRLKVFSTCGDWLEEYRSYHRKDGKIVAINDDLLKASFYAIMMIRYAAPEIIHRRQIRTTQAGMRMWG